MDENFPILHVIHPRTLIAIPVIEQIITGESVLNGVLLALVSSRSLRGKGKDFETMTYIVLIDPSGELLTDEPPIGHLEGKHLQQ